VAKPDLIGGGSTNYDTHGVYTESGLKVGTVGVLNGRSYVWCSHTGSSVLNSAEPLVAAEITPDVQDLEITTTGMTIGQKRIVDITAGGAAIAANAFNEGYMMVVDGGGQGVPYVIKQNLAFTASTADGTIYLEEPIVSVSDASTQVSLIRNKFVDPQQSNSFGHTSFIGVPHIEVPAGNSTTQYFWVQRNGYCPVFVEGTPRRGTKVLISRATDGRLASITEDVEIVESTSGGAKHIVTFDTTQIVGVMVTDAKDGEVQIVDLQNPIF
jgi:hypothetical protein